MKYLPKGNITIITLIITITILIIFISFFDLCRIFIAREETKNAADAVSLAISQNLIFFEKKEIKEIAYKVLSKYDCELIDCQIAYDEVVVIVGKKINLIILDKFNQKYSVVNSISRAKVIYPWDKSFNYCKYYKYNH